MRDAKRAAVPEGVSTPQEVTSYIRSHDAEDALPPPGLGSNVPELTAESFLEDWALRHFTISVKLHDAERLSEGDPERLLVLEELAVVQGILIELHEFATSTEAVRNLMSEMQVVQNSVSALYTWLDDLLDAALLRPVARRRPGFVDAGPDTLTVITSALERVHPDLESLVRAGADDTDGGVARKLSLCFRQIGAAIVRVSGRATSLPPPPR
jgi:hypothetical protein